MFVSTTVNDPIAKDQLAVVEGLAAVALPDELACRDQSIFLSAGVHHLEIVVVAHERRCIDQVQTLWTP